MRRLLAAVLAGLLASPALPALPARSGPERAAWVRFDDAASLDFARAIVASDVPGDASLATLSVGEGMLRVDGRLGLDGGSRWATLGAEIAPEGVEAGLDMRGAGVLRIRLASAVPRPLRVRIKGSDREIGSAGCYPVVVQMVGTTPADYLMPLSAFHAPGWCGADAPSIEQALRAVQRVEVTANDEPAGAVRFEVGRIDFLAGDAGEPEGRQREEPPQAIARASAPVPAPVASPAAGARRKLAAAAPVPVPAPAPVPPAAARRVTCEFSARYQLMLCH